MTVLTTMIDHVPNNMWKHRDDSSLHGYPAGVTHETLVEVVLDHKGMLSLHRGQAQNFGWQIEPHAPAYIGLIPCLARLPTIGS
jgi:hypothetical protein